MLMDAPLEKKIVLEHHRPVTDALFWNEITPPWITWWKLLCFSLRVIWIQTC